MQVCYIVILDLRCNIYMTCGLFLILHRVLCVLAIDPETSTECTETPVCDEPGRYILAVSDTLCGIKNMNGVLSIRKVILEIKRFMVDFADGVLEATPELGHMEYIVYSR